MTLETDLSQFTGQNSEFQTNHSSHSTASEQLPVREQQASASGMGTEGALKSEGVCPCNTPLIIDNTSDKTLKSINPGEPEGRVLIAGIDTLYLSVYCEWEEDNEHEETKKTFLQGLKELKQEAIESKSKTLGGIREKYGKGAWIYVMQPKGLKAYNFILIGEERDFSFHIYEGENAGNRPRVIIEFRSKYLHAVGYEKAVKRALGVLRDSGAKIKHNGVLVSRMDIYCDYLDKGENISSDTRNTIKGKVGPERNMHEANGLETLYVGARGADIQLRIYDKSKQLKSIGQEGSLDREWDLTPGENHTIFRIEYQLKRTALKALGIDRAEHIPGKEKGLWGYLTKEWSIDLEKEDTHKERRIVKKYWKEIQQAFDQGENVPAIEKQERPRINVLNPWATARQVFKSLAKHVAECIVTTQRMPANICIQTGIDFWVPFLIWKHGLTDELFDQNVRQEVVNVRSRKEKEKLRILKKVDGVTDISEGGLEDNLENEGEQLADAVRKKLVDPPRASNDKDPA